jgi:hypothetical protein
LKEGVLLEPVSFAAQPFDPVAVDSLFKMTAAGAKTRLQGRFSRAGL